MTIDIVATACSTPDEFMLHLRRSNPRWAVRRTSSDAAWVFRGQAWLDSIQTTHHLVPSALRPTTGDTLLARTRRILEITNERCNWKRWVRPSEDRPPDVPGSIWRDRVCTVALEALAHAVVVKDWVLL